MSTKQNDKDGEQSTLIKLPQRIPLFTTRDRVILPGMQTIAGTGYGHLVEAIKEKTLCVIVPVITGGNPIPTRGVLAFLDHASIAKNGSHYTMRLQALRRVEISNILHLPGDPRAEAYDGEWREIESEEISEEDWGNPKYEGQCMAFAEAANWNLSGMLFIVQSQVGHFHAAYAQAPEDYPDAKGITHEFDQTLRDIRSLSLQLKIIERSAMEGLIDRAAGLVSRFIFNSEFSEEEQEAVWGIVEGLYEVLTSEKVLERLKHMLPALHASDHLLKGYIALLEGTVVSESDRGEAPGVQAEGDLPEEVQKVIRDESRKMRNPNSAEAETAETYIGWLRRYPWNKSTKDNEDFSAIPKVLDADHYKLEEAKEQIIEFLAARSVNPRAKGSILCFVGPPGIGKTSLGESIARATGRKFVRESLGGIHDEAEIRGHRRTYIGALPGIIVQGMVKAGKNNPVFMLDEVDKLGSRGGEKGDVPENALVEVLDPKQNHAFKDHYFGTELPIDLSQVLFILTANTLDTMSGPVRDRIEIIELPGYTDEEKVVIAEKYLVPKILGEFGIDPHDLDPEKFKAKNLPVFTIYFSQEALEEIVGEYTYDAGMRATEKKLRRIVKKILREVREGKLEIFRSNGNGKHQASENESVEQKADVPTLVRRITPRIVRGYLGEPKPREWMPDLGNLQPGVSISLAVDANGQGCLMPIEVSVGKASHFKIKATGLLGDVMEESTDVVISRLLHYGGILEGMAHKFYVHIHCDDGGTPKNGPSAGTNINVAAYSALATLLLSTPVPVKPYFAVTGEITLKRAVVLPIGGVKNKLLAARKNGIRDVAIPLANLKDLGTFSGEYIRKITPENKGSKSWQEVSREEKPKGSFTIYCVEKPEDVLEIAFPNPEHYPPKPEWFAKKEPKE